MSPDEPVDEPLVEPLRLLRCIEGNRTLLDTRRAEIIAGAADRNNQGPVRHRAGRSDLLPFGIEARGETDFSPFPIEADHFSDPVAKVVVGGMREIINRITAHVQSTRGNFVQVRLPDVNSRALNERDLCPSSPSKTVAQLCRKL
jgi:hypothetical protein